MLNNYNIPPTTYNISRNGTQLSSIQNRKYVIKVCITNRNILYFKGKAECDFLMRDGIDITEAIQVCHAFGDKETRDRELKGLMEAIVTYHLDSGWILTDDTEETLEQNGKMIRIMPVWKWMMI